MITWKAHPREVRGVAFSPDGRLLATYGDGDTFARVWDVVTQTEFAAFKTPARAYQQSDPSVTCVAFSHCGKYFAVGGVWALDTDPCVRIWDLANKDVVIATLRPRTTPMAMLFTPGDDPGLVIVDGSRINYFQNAIASNPAAPNIFNRGPDRQSPRCSRVTASADFKWIATNGRPKAVVWDAKTLKPKFMREHPRGPQNGPAAFNPNGEVLAVAHGTKVDLWRFADANAEAVELAGHKLPVWAVGYLHEGRTVQTASSDGTIRLWDAATGTESHRFDFKIGKIYCAAFAPDGLTCAAGGENGQVLVWDVDA